MKCSKKTVEVTAKILLTAIALSSLLPLYAMAQLSGSAIIIDRADKQNITGTTEIAFAWGQQLQPPQNLRLGVMNLMEAMNAWTKVQTSLNRNLMLSDKSIMNYPFVFITADKRFELTQTEISNMREYISNGGFLFVDNAQPVNDKSQSGSLLKQMLEQVIPNARFEILPNSHEIYTSFFDFDGPPQGSELGVIAQGSDYTVLSQPRHYLEGVYYRGRLVAVYSDKGYILNWTQGDSSDDTQGDTGGDPQLRMGVNLIIYALTQEGSIATQSTR